MNCLVGSIVLTLGSGLWLPAAHAGTTLDPENPGHFTKEGNESFTPGPVLTLTDTASSDFVASFAPDGDAAPGTEIDVTATFQIQAHVPNNADAGNRVVINDGAARSAIAACIIKNGERGIGLLSQGAASDPAAYPVFVAVDWGLPVTIRLRRTATGDAEIIEVNGATPNPRAILLAAQCPAPTRTFSSVEFGCRSVEARCTVEYAAFRSGVVAPVGIADGAVATSAPTRFELLGAEPNPFNPSTTIRHALPKTVRVELEIYYARGALVRELVKETLGVGVHSAIWNGRNDSGKQVSSGVYFYALAAGNFRGVSSLVLLKNNRPSSTAR